MSNAQIITFYAQIISFYAQIITFYAQIISFYAQINTLFVHSVNQDLLSCYNFEERVY